MGMFDTVYCQANIPDAELGPKPEFQTYSLGRGMGRYTITADGRLLSHPVRSHPLDPPEAGRKASLPPCEWIELPPIDLEFHGDLLVHLVADQPGCHEYVARFTHGSLEWIRPVTDVSAVHRDWLMTVTDR
jgi:hypothetical protein